MLGFRANPKGGTLNLTTRLSRFDFEFEAVDAAIDFGLPDWPGAEMALLMRETVVPACSPGLRQQYLFGTPADLLNAPLLPLVSSPDAWERWLHAHGAPASEVRGMLFDQFAVAAQAAISGLGIALLPRFLIKAEIERDDLVEAVAHTQTIESAERYYLAWPASRSGCPPLQAFRQWLCATARAD